MSASSLWRQASSAIHTLSHLIQVHFCVVRRATGHLNEFGPNVVGLAAHPHKQVTQVSGRGGAPEGSKGKGGQAMRDSQLNQKVQPERQPYISCN